MKTGRRYDVDWLRVLGTLAVFGYHISMFVNSFDWHVKNLLPTSGFDIIVRLMIPWIMPLFFVISGIGTHYALQRRGGAAFAKERLLRLGVPLLLTAFILSPHQVYIERLTKGQFQGSFLQFLPHYFDGFYFLSPTGNFAWMGLHLWYVTFLLVFSLVTLPILRRSRLWAWLGARVGAVGLLLLPPVLLLLLRLVLDPDGVGIYVTGWPVLLYLTFYLLGAGLFPLEAFRAAVRARGPWLLGAALLSMIFYVAIDNQAPFGPTAGWAVSAVGWVLAGWFSLLGLFYLADRYLTTENRFLRYGSQASMPFYILHQPVIVLLGFFLRTVAMAPVLKFGLLFIVAFVLTLGLYHWIVRTIPVLQFLFGVKAPGKKVKAEGAAA